jgi:hypothetical protein
MLNVAFSYPELNKWRIFFRVIFAAGTIMLGSDATTKAKKINLNRWVPANVRFPILLTEIGSSLSA